MENRVRKNSYFYIKINLVFSCIIFTFGMAEGARARSAGCERVERVLEEGDDVAKIRGALELSERLNGRKMNKEELGYLLFYAVEASTPPAINLVLDFGACIYTAIRTNEFLSPTTVYGISLRRAGQSIREVGIERSRVSLEVLRTVAQAGGFDGVGEGDLSDSSLINAIIAEGKRERDRFIGQHLLEVFGKRRASLIKGYAASFPGPKQISGQEQLLLK